MVPSSNEPSSLDSRHFNRVCSQRVCGTLLWPESKGDICDRCLAGIDSVCNTSINPMDATRVYAEAASPSEGVSHDTKDLTAEATSVSPAVPGLATCPVPPPKYPLPSPYLLPNSQLGSSHSFEAEVGSKPPEHNSLSMSYQGRRSVTSPSSAIVPLYNHHGLRHKPNVYNLTEEENRTQPQLCGVCRAVIHSETVCPRCRCNAAAVKEETRVDISEPKDIAAKSDLEDDLSTAVMSIFSNLDENVDDTDDMDMEGIELSYPELTDSGAIEEPQLQPVQENSSCSKELLRPEKSPQHSGLGFSQNFSNRKETPRPAFRSLKLCSTVGCTGTISSESLATRCLGCVRRDWRSKISRGRAGRRGDDGRLSSDIRRSISTTQTRKAKKAVTWADEVSHTPLCQKKLECTPTIKQLQHNTPCTDLNLKSEIHSVDSPILIDDDPPVGLSVGRLPSHSTEARVPIKSLEPNGPMAKSEDLPVFTHARDLPSSTSSIPAELVSSANFQRDTQVKSVRSIESIVSNNTAEVSIFGGSSDLSDLSDSGDDSEDISSLDSQEVGPCLPKLETSPPSALTGLKIRVPPRPGLYVRKCGSIRCEQRLSATYQWKSCVICRARSRGYQHLRQNLQGRHSQLEESPGNFARDTLVVAGARLCANRNCAYIIPPSSEYLWKKCALCRLRASSSRKFSKASSSPQAQEIDSRAKIAERLPRRDKQLPGRCESLDCGMLLSGEQLALDCNQCVARSSYLDGTPKQSMLGRKDKSIPTHPSLAPSPYPRYKAFANLLADLKARFNDFLQAQSVFFLYNAADSRYNLAKAMFIFDAEYSVVALDFDIVGRKDAVDANVLKLKGEIERMGRIQFSPKRYISILEGGGIAERFLCLKQAPVLQTVSDGQKVSTVTYVKNMQGELEIAIVPDRSHPLLPGQRTIVRFRLLG